MGIISLNSPVVLGDGVRNTVMVGYSGFPEPNGNGSLSVSAGPVQFEMGLTASSSTSSTDFSIPCSYTGETIDVSASGSVGSCSASSGSLTAGVDRSNCPAQCNASVSIESVGTNGKIMLGDGISNPISVRYDGFNPAGGNASLIVSAGPVSFNMGLTASSSTASTIFAVPCSHMGDTIQVSAAGSDGQCSASSNTVTLGVDRQYCPSQCNASVAIEQVGTNEKIFLGNRVSNPISIRYSNFPQPSGGNSSLIVTAGPVSFNMGQFYIQHCVLRPLHIPGNTIQVQATGTSGQCSASSAPVTLGVDRSVCSSATPTPPQLPPRPFPRPPHLCNATPPCPSHPLEPKSTRGV